MSDAWSNGLFSCTKDCTNFLIACCVPCGLHYLHAKATERATNSGINLFYKIQFYKINYFNQVLLA